MKLLNLTIIDIDADDNNEFTISWTLFQNKDSFMILGFLS